MYYISNSSLNLLRNLAFYIHWALATCEHLDAETKVKRLQQDNIELEDCKRALENQKDGMYNSSLSSKCFKPFLKRTGGIIFYGLDFYE